MGTHRVIEKPCSSLFLHTEKTYNILSRSRQAQNGPGVNWTSRRHSRRRRTREGGMGSVHGYKIFSTE